MFGLFKKKKKETKPKGFYSMVSGTSMDITEVDDEMFAGKLLGDGIAVKPSDDLFVAPCNGTITTVMDSKHAIGLEDENGVQVLIHIGLDTVTLNGEGFEVYCKVGDKVQVGAPLVKVDRKLLQEKNIRSTRTPPITRVERKNTSPCSTATGRTRRRPRRASRGRRAPRARPRWS